MTNGLSHPYHLDESTFISRGIRSSFSLLFHFSMKFMLAKRIAPDGTLLLAVSHLGLFCLPVSHIKYVRLIWVNLNGERCYSLFTLLFLKSNQLSLCLCNLLIGV